MDDSISRQAAIEAVEILLEQTEEDADVKTWNNAIRGAINSIKHHVPSAQQVRTQMSSADDLISRQAAIDRINKQREHLRPDIYEQDYIGDAAYRICAEFIERLPSAQPEPQWIPVSERLPEEYGNYLISIHGEDEPDIGTINPNDKRGWSLCDANGFHWASDKELIVTAWKPLPKPYRAEGRTDDLQ